MSDIIVVRRCTTMPRPVQDSATVACNTCKSDCYIAPSSVEHLRKHPRFSDLERARRRVGR